MNLNVVRVLNSFDPGQTPFHPDPSCLHTFFLVVISGLRVNRINRSFHNETDILHCLSSIMKPRIHNTLDLGRYNWKTLIRRKRKEFEFVGYRRKLPSTNVLVARKRTGSQSGYSFTLNIWREIPVTTNCIFYTLQNDIDGKLFLLKNQSVKFVISRYISSFMT